MYFFRQNKIRLPHEPLIILILIMRSNSYRQNTRIYSFTNVLNLTIVDIVIFTRKLKLNVYKMFGESVWSLNSEYRNEIADKNVSLCPQNRFRVTSNYLLLLSCKKFLLSAIYFIVQFWNFEIRFPDINRKLTAFKIVYAGIHYVCIYLISQ